MISTKHLVLLSMTLLACPAAAHDPAGTPKNFCEDPSEWPTHDFAPVAVGIFNFMTTDGNMLGDCDGDTVPADFDGHSEWTQGGGMILSESGDGVTGGSLACFGAVGHHPYFGPFVVEDAILGNSVAFIVASDFVNLFPPTDPAAPVCGDGSLDAATTCVGTCTVTFPAGLDGAYYVNVGEGWSGGVGTFGHVCAPICVDHV